MALIYPQGEFVMTVISGYFWNNGVMEQWSNAKYKNRKKSYSSAFIPILPR